MDGTLIDSARTHAKAFKKELAGLGHVIQEQQILNLFGMHAHQIIKEIAPLVPEEKILGLIREKDKLYRKYLENGEVKLNPGVKQTLKELKRKGCTLCVASSDTRKNLLLDIKVFGLQELFDVITSAQEIVHPKPHPEQLLLTARKAGVKPKNCVMVGDSEFDVTAGKRAKMKTVLLSGTLKGKEARKTGADHVIKKMKELLKIL